VITRISQSLRRQIIERDNPPTALVGGNPKGIAADSPGLVLLPWVMEPRRHGVGVDGNPERVAACGSRYASSPRFVVNHQSRNPVGVGALAALFPRVAEYSNPGLEDGSPSGKMSKLQTTW
jgi:hypothetical protein